MKSLRAGAIVGLAVVGAAVLWGVGSPAFAADGARLGVVPADEPSYFHSELLAGGMTRRVAVVSNHSATVETIAVYAADGLTTPQGGFSVRTLLEPRVIVGAWARLPVATLTLRAGEQRRVPFELTVPVGTPRGDYSGGIRRASPAATG